MIISAIGQMADFAEGLERLDSGRGAIAIDPVYQVKKMPKHFAGGDAIRPHLLTTAIGHGRIAAETISDFLLGDLGERRPKVDAHQFNLLAELHERQLDPAPYDHRQERGTDVENVRDPQLRGSRRDPDHSAHRAVQGPFQLCRARPARRAPRPCARGARRFRGAHRRPLRSAGAQGGRALHELRPLLRVRQLRHLLPADRRAAACRRRSARSGATSTPITRSASAATSAWTSARPATSRWASGSRSVARARTAMVLAALFAGAATFASALADEGAGRTPMPVIPKGKGDHCVRDTAFMRRYHMTMLKSSARRHRA